MHIWVLQQDVLKKKCPLGQYRRLWDTQIIIQRCHHVLDDIKLKEAERLGDFLDNTKAAQRVVQDELLGIM